MNKIRLKLTPPFEAYLIGLIYCDTPTTCLSLSALCPWVSHDTLSHLLQAGLSWSGGFWTGMACRLLQAGGDWVLDDTTWQRWAKKAEAVSFAWCGPFNQVVTGMQVVLLIWNDGHSKVLIGLRL